VPVDTPDAVDRVLRVVGGTERGGREEGTRPLQTAPWVVAVIGVLRDRDHGPRMQRLQQQRAKAADEHRGIGVHAPDRAVSSEPARSRVVETRPVSRPLGTRDPGEKRLAQAPLQRVKARGRRLRYGRLPPRRANLRLSAHSHLLRLSFPD
jgi:hypothetical protein